MFTQTIESLLLQLNTVLVGKKQQVQDCVTCLLAGGHLLLEDIPGVGKTTLAHALAHSFGSRWFVKRSVYFLDRCIHLDKPGTWERPACLFSFGQKAFQ